MIFIQFIDGIGDIKGCGYMSKENKFIYGRKFCKLRGVFIILGGFHLLRELKNTSIILIDKNACLKDYH